MSDLVPTDNEAQIEAQVSERLNSMDPLKEQVLDATTEFLQGWIWDETDAVIDAEPARVVELGSRGVRRLRKKVERLEKKMPRTVRRKLGKSDLWVHQSSDPAAALNAGAAARFKNPYRSAVSAMPKLFDRPFKLVLTRLGKIHRRFKIGESRWSKSKSVTGMLDYHRPVKISEAVDDALTAYADAVEELRALLGELIDLSEARVKDEASSLWHRGS